RDSPSPKSSWKTARPLRNSKPSKISTLNPAPPPATPKKTRLLLPLFALLSCAHLPRHAQTPTHDAIPEFLKVSGARQTLDLLWENFGKLIDQNLQSSIPKDIANKLSEKDKQIIERYKSSMLSAMQEELMWSKLEPTFLKIYQDLFTQEEMDQILAFYRSPAGKALVAKQPEIASKSMQLMQGLMPALLAKIDKLAKDLTSELEAASAPKK
ncbi:MAG: hypothetical protein RLZZ244_1245, partial [Verrucomicrobiota bacterium]